MIRARDVVPLLPRLHGDTASPQPLGALATGAGWSPLAKSAPGSGEVEAGELPGGSYVTDPADHPDTSAWRTEIYWPVSQ